MVALALLALASVSRVTLGSVAPQAENVSPYPAPQNPVAQLTVAVADENHVAVPAARVTLTSESNSYRGETDYAGKWASSQLVPGTYQVRVDKETFYAVVLNEVRVGETDSVEVTLNHVREYLEVVNVVYSAPAIDPVETSSNQSLSNEDVLNVPYGVTRDIRYALPLMPGVLQDGFGQIHVNGSSTRQVRDHLDGFEITDPANGLFTLRVSADAVRSMEIQGSRVPAEYGKGTGGVLNLRTGMGDNRLRFSATDFVPSLQYRKGININTWLPRAMLSGPIRKGRAWFMNALDAEYDLAIFEELPKGADRNPAWLISNLAKAQVNLTPGNILTFSYLLNRYQSSHVGLSPFDPIDTTVRQVDSTDVFSIKDQAFLSKGVLLETGVSASSFRSRSTPMGVQPYVIRPGSTSGNYFATWDNGATRVEAISNLIFPAVHWKGRHEFRTGIDLTEITTRLLVTRRPFTILREDGSLTRAINFINHPESSQGVLELSSYAQDRWTVQEGWLVEGGVRLDWDDQVRRASFAPRLATSLMLTGDGRTKLTAGFGTYYDATSLDLILRGRTGERFDLFYDATGANLVRPPVQTLLLADPQRLRVPRFVNWSVELQRKLPAAIYLQLEFIQKRGKNGWAFVNPGAARGGPFSGAFELAGVRRDRYDAVEIIARRTIKDRFLIFASYTRSAARSTAVLNFSLDNPLFSAQAGGPLPWDAPNRLNTWGYLPLVRRFTLAYWLDWRDGFPFTLFNQDQQLVGAPGSQRFPTYFSLNLHAERRFRLLGFEWALRAGFNNITNHKNPTVVNSNVDSPNFLTFAGVQSRAFTGRVRLLGRK